MKAKKVLAMLMASAMIMGTTVTAFANNPGEDGQYGTSDDKGTITISGIANEKDNTNITVTAYPIIKAQYDNNGSFSGYEALYDEVNDIADDNGVINVSQDQLNAVLGYIRGGNLAVDKTYSLRREGDTDTFSSEEDTVPVGSYVVVISGAETKIYNAVVASVEYVYNETDGSTGVADDIVDIEDADNLWVKVTNTPTIEKKVTDTDEIGVKGNSVKIGDDVTYTVTINSVPNYGGDYPVLYVEDTLSDGLKYNNDLKVVATSQDGLTSKELVQGTDYFLSVDGQKITVNFVDQRNNDYKLDKFVGGSVTITYTAEVTNAAQVNEDGNNNDAVLNYTNDSKTTGNDGSDEDKTYTYTFDIDGSTTGTKNIITKVGEDEDSEALDGAVFEIYQKDASGTIIPYTNDSNTLSDLDNDGIQNDVASDAEGQLYISGLAAGTYYLKEVSAPDGYSVNTHEYEIVITTDYNSDGTLRQWKVEIDGEVTSTFEVTHDSNGSTMDSDINKTEIKNTKLSSLPSTGGIGTTIFTIGGCAIMVTAAGLYFATRKKEQK